ncbi:MAG: hypothetical protein K2P84_14835 [Undibacterium sp.]|nr:hypothetical protein [Undibacterium sp.]
MLAIIAALLTVSMLHTLNLILMFFLDGTVIILMLLFLRKFMRSQQTYLLSFNDTGDIVLHTYDAQNKVSESKNVTLQSPAICWSNLILLNLLDENKQLNRLIVLPDSVVHEGFRQILVTIKCLVQRENVQGEIRGTFK